MESKNLKRKAKGQDTISSFETSAKMYQVFEIAWKKGFKNFILSDNLFRPKLFFSSHKNQSCPAFQRDGNSTYFNSPCIITQPDQRTQPVLATWNAQEPVGALPSIANPDFDHVPLFG